MSEEKIEKIIAKQNAAQIDTCNNMKPTVVGPINWEIIRERERDSGRKNTCCCSIVSALPIYLTKPDL